MKTPPASPPKTRRKTAPSAGFWPGTWLADPALAQQVGDGYDVIVANIVADVIRAMAGLFWQKTAPGRHAHRLRHHRGAGGGSAPGAGRTGVLPAAPADAAGLGGADPDPARIGVDNQAVFCYNIETNETRRMGNFACLVFFWRRRRCAGETAVLRGEDARHIMGALRHAQRGMS